MQSTPIQARPVNRVLAVFGAGAVLFELSPAATFEHLARRLRSLRQQYGSPLISIDLRFGAQAPPARRSVVAAAAAHKRDRVLHAPGATRPPLR